MTVSSTFFPWEGFGHDEVRRVSVYLYVLQQPALRCPQVVSMSVEAHGGLVFSLYSVVRGSSCCLFNQLMDFSKYWDPGQHKTSWLGCLFRLEFHLELAPNCGQRVLCRVSHSRRLHPPHLLSCQPMESRLSSGGALSWPLMEESPQKGMHFFVASEAMKYPVSLKPTG